MDVCKKALISGRVQGVWFRASTREKAEKLGLSGWARNLSDGRVEVLMCGSEKNIEALTRWLHSGPPLAKVKDVIISDVESAHITPEDYAGFTTE